MKRFTFVLAFLLLVLALPAWRLVDWMAIIWPNSLAFNSFIGLWSVIFLCIPLKILRPKLPPFLMLLPFILFFGLSFTTPSLSKMATRSPIFNHCGQLTYTGVFYPLSPILSSAYQDDLDARNQLCWLRKMIIRIPSQFESEEELSGYLKLMDERLQTPEFKYKVSLPLLIIFLGQSVRSLEMTSATMDTYESTKTMIRGVPYWTEKYQDEISKRKYGWWDWPYSSMIQSEYGFIEEHLGKLQLMMEDN